MLVGEMNCILILLKKIINGEEIDHNIDSFFSSKDEFMESKGNLFTLISINEILKFYKDNPSFSLETFLKTGAVNGLYNQETHTPEIGFMKNKGTKSFFDSLLKAFQENDYSFDSNNYLNIFNEEIAVTIPQVWLYRLGQAMKKDSYERIFFYNKNKPNRIANKEELLDYLRKTKTFIVTMSSNKKGMETSITFSTLEAKINYELKGRKEVKVEDIMSLFKDFVPGDYRAKVSKYKISEEFWLISKAEQLGNVFYDESIEVQEKFLNKWMLERVNSLSYQDEEAQKFILLSGSNKENIDIDALNKALIIAGLFKLYIRLLQTVKIDLSAISLRDFKLKAYLDEDSQTRKTAHSSVYNLTDLSIITKEAKQLLIEISSLDVMKDLAAINQKRARYEELISIIENSKNGSFSNSFESNDIAELAFDNEKIMKLIGQAVENGRIYVDKNELVIELFDKDMTSPLFKSGINLNRLLDFMLDINLNLMQDDFGTPSK